MNMRRLFKKLVFVCLLVVFGEKTVCHAHLPEYVSSDRPWWVFNTFEKWEVVNDTICGEGVQWNFFFLNGNTVTLNGKEYKPVLFDRRDLVPALQEMRKNTSCLVFCPLYYRFFIRCLFLCQKQYYIA